MSFREFLTESKTTVKASNGKLTVKNRVGTFVIEPGMTVWITDMSTSSPHYEFYKNVQIDGNTLSGISQLSPSRKMKADPIPLEWIEQVKKV